VKSFSLARYALCGGIAVVLLAGCGAKEGTPLNPSATPAEKTRARSPRFGTVFAISISGAERVLYTFRGSSDGANPQAGLLNVSGTFYGTTVNGGANNKGTVFPLTRHGDETVLHSFGGSGDGANPEASLIDVNGTLYGTTRNGGSYGYGTAFSIDTSGAETVLHSFAGPPDGQFPVASLLDVGDMLYGTTAGGGSSACGGGSFHGCGTVFKMTKAGAVTVLHSFPGAGGDGVDPLAALINVGGKLYGTTYGGGNRTIGTVFSSTLRGNMTQLHSFEGYPGDGEDPHARLVNVDGTLYGTTAKGGAQRCARGCDGTVFKISTSGTETMLYSFGGPQDGEHPVTGLLDVNGTLYGTTYGDNAAHNAGAVFSITTSGAESVIHNFGGSGDGKHPSGDLIEVDGTLYGTTTSGGAP
jgi:uncharacterized repeat protein (TIGR03803 family)